MRFRCVCKSWHALISDPNFINTHLNQTRVNNKGYVLIKHRDSDLDKFSLRCDETFVAQKRLELPFKKNVESLKVEGYCNGLLCLSCLGTPRIQRDLYLWNPAIQKLKRLPQSTPITERFACIYFAFGHVPQIDDYRVVKFVYHRYIPCVNGIYNAALRCLKAPPEAELYSLRTNSWKAIENVFPCVIQSCSKDPIWNGVVHWLARVYQEDGPFYEFVLSFDMGNEIFGEILFESSQSVAAMIVYWTSVQRRIRFLCLSILEKGRRSVWIWVMKEYGALESWTKQFTFDQRVNFIFPLLGLMKNGEVVLKDDDGELVLYDPRVQQVKEIQIRGVQGSLDVLTFYMESLVCLNEGN